MNFSQRTGTHFIQNGLLEKVLSRVSMCSESTYICRTDGAGKMCAESGQVIIDGEEIYSQWKAYFSDLLQEAT